MRKILVVLVMACFLTGCVGFGQSGLLGGDRMKVTTKFKNLQAGELDKDGNPTEGELIEWEQTMVGNPGQIMTMLGIMGIRVQTSADEYWTINVGQEAKGDSTVQAAMLSALGLAEYEFAAKVSADVVSAAINAVLPGYLAKTEAGVAKKQIDADTLRLIASEVVRLIEGGGALQPPG